MRSDVRGAYLEFVHTHEFTDSCEGLLSQGELRELENDLLADPEAGPPIAGTGGVRKMRFALGGRGRSGGVRVLYVYARRDERIYFLLAYAKSVRATLTQGEKNALKLWVQSFKEPSWRV